jgi:RNA polymerase sigma-70 factor (ECF subfamily)
VELLLRACAGDRDAFDDLVVLLDAPVRRYVRRLVGWHDDEDDIVQGVFIALYQHMRRIDPPGYLRPYLFRMVRNRTYDMLRAQQRVAGNLSLDDEPVELQVSFTADDGGTHEDLAHWLLLHLEVREAMDQLPDVYREALYLYSEEEMTYAEIAAATRSQIGTVKSRIHHAKKRLRSLLRPATLLALDAALLETDGHDTRDEDERHDDE